MRRRWVRRALIAGQLLWLWPAIDYVRWHRTRRTPL